MDENQKQLEILRRTKKRRKQIDITIILAALAVLFLLAGIRLGEALYFVVAVVCGLFTLMLIVDLRRTKRRLAEQDEHERLAEETAREEAARAAAKAEADGEKDEE